MKTSKSDSMLKENTSMLQSASHHAFLVLFAKHISPRWKKYVSHHTRPSSYLCFLWNTSTIERNFSLEKKKMPRLYPQLIHLGIRVRNRSSGPHQPLSVHSVHCQATFPPNLNRLDRRQSKLRAHHIEPQETLTKQIFLTAIQSVILAAICFQFTQS